MNKLVGRRWGLLSQEVKSKLLETAHCIDAENCKDVVNGECTVDLIQGLSVVGKIVEYEIYIEDDAILYNPEEGIILEGENE